jgi:hypothetical protein
MTEASPTGNLRDAADASALPVRGRVQGQHYEAPRAPSCWTHTTHGTYSATSARPRRDGQRVEPFVFLPIEAAHIMAFHGVE